MSKFMLPIILLVLGVSGTMYYYGPHIDTRSLADLIPSIAGQKTAARVSAQNATGSDTASASGPSAKVVAYITAIKHDEYATAYRLTTSYQRTMSMYADTIRAQYPRSMWKAQFDEREKEVVSEGAGQSNKYFGYWNANYFRPAVQAIVIEARTDTVFVEIEYPVESQAPFVASSVASRYSNYSRAVYQRLKTGTLAFAIDERGFISGITVVEGTFKYFMPASPQLVAVTWTLGGNDPLNYFGHVAHRLDLHIYGGTRPYSVSRFTCSSSSGSASYDMLSDSHIAGDDMNIAMTANSYTGENGGIVVGYNKTINSNDLPLSCDVLIADSTDHQGAASFQAQFPQAPYPAVMPTYCWIEEGVLPFAGLNSNEWEYRFGSNCFRTDNLVRGAQ